MNRAVLIGNLTRDPESKTTPSGVSCATFTVACQRKYVTKDGKREADFINCVAWRQTADYVLKYFRKGSKAAVEGTIQTRTYDAKDGTKRYVTEINVENVENHSPRQEGAGAAQGEPEPPRDEQTGFSEVNDDELPF